MKIAVTICATLSYSYALKAQARRVHAAILKLAAPNEGMVILVGDENKDLRSTEALYKKILPQSWKVQVIIGKYQDKLKNYSNPAQLLIAQMRSMAFDEARAQNVDFCWSLDSDVLPPANALDCMIHMLAFDSGMYAISTCPYPSQGGGDFLGGRGTPQHPILPDFYDEERMIPPKLAKRMKKHRDRAKQFQAAQQQPDAVWMKELQYLQDQIKRCAPKGNVWQMNGKNFRRRGWLSAAYPGVGWGAVLPSDWCGFGCTLMGREALALAQFDGYDGNGTEDLYIVWKKWYRAGLKINVIAHAPCDHVIRNPEKRGYFILLQAFHEDKGECVGHLRIEKRPWYEQVAGEKFDPKNTGT